MRSEALAGIDVQAQAPEAASLEKHEQPRRVDRVVRVTFVEVVELGTGQAV
jgi:hypothetical protein